jgi:predicted double-glycine peptidase
MRYFMPLALALASAVCSVASAQTAMPVTIDGQPAVSKRVTSMAAMRYRNVMRQELDFSCGAAALGTLLRYGYGVEIDERQIIHDMLKISDAEEVMRRGFSMLDMRNYVETLGYRGTGFRVEINALRQLKIPVIVLLDIKGYQHFVVVRRASHGRVFVSDPALGNRIMPEHDFVAAWNNLVFAVIGQPFPETSDLLEADAPALRQRTDTAMRAASRAPAVDFGLAHLDFF